MRKCGYRGTVVATLKWRRFYSGISESRLPVGTLSCYSLRLAISQGKDNSYIENVSLDFLCQPCLRGCGRELWLQGLIWRTCRKSTFVSFLSSYHHGEAESAQVVMGTTVSLDSCYFLNPHLYPAPISCNQTLPLEFGALFMVWNLEIRNFLDMKLLKGNSALEW